MTWQEASNQCFAFNSIMVEINSKAESEAINDQIRAKGYKFYKIKKKIVKNAYIYSFWMVRHTNLIYYVI